MTTFRPIPRKAIILGIAIGVVIVGFAAQVVWQLRVETGLTATRNARDVATSLAHDVERTLQTYDLSLQAIVVDLTTAGLMELPPDLRDRVLFDSSIKAKYLGPLLVVNSHGTVFIDSESRIPRSENLKDRDFFKFHQSHASKTLHIGAPFKAANGEYRISLSRRLEIGDGVFSGVVVGTIDLAYFRELFSKIDLGAESSLSLFLDEGTLLARSPYREVDIGRSMRGAPHVETMVAERQGTIRARSSTDGVDRVYVYQHVGDFPIVLAVAQASEAIYGSWQRRALVIGTGAALLLLGCGALALILRRELVRRAAVESELFAQGERLQVTLRSIGDAVLSTDSAGAVLFMNAIAERMSGWTGAEARGRPAREVFLITREGSRAACDPIARALADQVVDMQTTASILHRRGGGQFAVEESARPIRNDAGQIVGAVMVVHDVSETRAMSHRMTHLAQHDTLTDLPNRMLFQDRLHQAIERSARSGRKTAVLFMDLDGFKHVNDSLGHLAGDQLLIEMATRLKGCVRETDTVSRQGGDEFVLLLTDLEDGQGPSRVADTILDRLSQPFEIEGNALSVTASIGIAVYPDDGDNAVELVKNADAAMYLAKKTGRNAYRFFTSELGSQALRRLNIERRIVEGLALQEFVLHYQPLCRADDGMPIGAEALVRWQRDGELVSPAEFIPIAEECGQIIDLGDAILAMACRAAVGWNSGRDEAFVVSVNVSGHQFRAKGFVERIAAVLKETGLAPRCLELEITESVLLHEVDRTETILRQLKRIGVSIALDDFGTGYSSLSYLSRFPVDRIKIDRSFVQSIASNPRNKAIVQTIVSLGRELGLKVIAEGVETLEQRKILTAMGCLELQGFLFGRPKADFDAALCLDEGDVAIDMVDEAHGGTLGSWRADVPVL